MVNRLCQDSNQKIHKPGVILR